MRAQVEGILRWWHLDAIEWALPSRTALAIAAIPLAIAAIGILAIPFRPVYRVLVNEDSLGEWLQFVLLITLLLLYGRLTVTLWRSGRRAHAALFAVAALGVAFVAGEEISWGQRIVGWQTPESLAGLNGQDETNIHNVSGVLRVFNLGVMGVCVVAMLLPLLRWTAWHDRARGITGYLLIPPLAILPAFALTFGYRAVRLLLLPEAGYIVSRYGELMELCFYFGLASFAWLSLRAIRVPVPRPRPLEAAPAALTVTGSN